MPRPRKQIPSYRLHKQSRQAVVTLTDPTGKCHDVLLGTYGTEESKAEYHRVTTEWETSGRQAIPGKSRSSSPRHTPADLTIAELAAAFLRHADGHYRRADGTPMNEIRDYKLSLRPLNHLYGHVPVAEFGPLGLKTVRQLMLDGYKHPKYGDQAPLARRVINQRVARIVRMFGWGVSEELIPETVHRALATVKGLQKGRTAARESEPVRPVAQAVVDATLPYLSLMLADMVRLQLHSGMRPGELMVLRACDIDVTGKVWLYKPRQHKTDYRDQGRTVPLGPRCQEIVKRHLTTELTAYLFSPRKVVEEQRATPFRVEEDSRTPRQSPRKQPRQEPAPDPRRALHRGQLRESHPPSSREGGRGSETAGHQERHGRQ